VLPVGPTSRTNKHFARIDDRYALMIALMIDTKETEAWKDLLVVE
jgi:hypothetical protein